ncbi:MAG TPA: carboxypeptidase-like regulatory domain-containing protein [Fimbriimonas sp.]
MQALLALGLIGCGGGGGNGDSGGNSEPGTVRGRVYAPDGRTPLGHASIEATPEGGTVVRTTSAPDGTFQLSEVPNGKTTFRITKGSWKKTLVANIGGKSELTSEQTRLPSSPRQGGAKIAVVTGEFDRVQAVLRGFGIEGFDVYDGGGPGEATVGSAADLLSSAGRMAGYDLIFVNCGADLGVNLENEAVRARLRDYVTGGGTLFTTDLESRIVRSAFPEDVAWVNGGGDDNVVTVAGVPDPALRTEMAALELLEASGRITIRGFTSGWSVIDAVPTTTQVLVQGPVSYYEFSEALLRHQPLDPPKTRGQRSGVRPLAVAFPKGEGSVVYLSFHASDESDASDLSNVESMVGLVVFRF